MVAENNQVEGATFYHRHSNRFMNTSYAYEVMELNFIPAFLRISGWLSQSRQS